MNKRLLGIIRWKTTTAQSLIKTTLLSFLQSRTNYLFSPPHLQVGDCITSHNFIIQVRPPNEYEDSIFQLGFRK